MKVSNQKVFLAIALLFVISNLYCQVESKLLRVPSTNKTKDFSRVTGFQTPLLNIKEIKRKDSVENANGLPFKFGEPIDVSLNVIQSGQRVYIGDTVQILYRINSNDAVSINLIFNDLFLTENSTLYLYNSTQTHSIGPITNSINPPNKIYWSDIVKGNEVIIDFKTLKKELSKNRLIISKIVHGYNNIFPENFGDSFSCNTDINCSQGNDWHNEADAVAMILLANGTRLCSGALINNTAKDFKPYFLTAFHCLDLQSAFGVLSASEKSDVNNWVFRFRYESPTCGGGDGTTFLSFNGSTFRAARQQTDFALLELSNNPGSSPCIKYAGWSRSTTAASIGVGIHHPVGDVKKISFDNDPLSSNSSTINWTDGTSSPSNTHWVVDFDQGTTQGGSSGSPIFDQNHRITGQLHGGFSGCAPITKFYGRLDKSWTGGGTNDTRLSNWLDPGNTGASTTNTMGMDILGPNFVCNTGQYTFVGQNPVWSTSNPSGLSIDQNTGLATRLNNFTGSVTVTASINAVCGVVNVTKLVNVGNYPPIGTSSVNSNCSGNSFNVLNTNLSGVCTANTAIYFTYRITDPNYSNFVFTPVSVPSGASWSSSGGNLYMTVYTPPTQGPRSATIALSATGPCGTYTVNFTSTAVNIYSSAFSMSPNPSNESVTVSMDNENSLDNQSQNVIYAIKITDHFGTPGKSFEFKDGINSVNISLQDLKSGLYVLSVFDGKLWSSKQLMVQK